jgi:VCBS repeat-containing protein
VFTHDHYGPSTHQQVGLYSTLLVEPEGSVWRHNETGDQLGTRHDGGPSGWQAIIEPGPDGVDFDPHREFYFEFADFQHAYEEGGGALGSLPNEQIPALAGAWPEEEIPSYADFDDAINPSFRQRPPNADDIYLHPNACPGPDPGQANLPRPCPEAISADDPGTYALNFRNEPIGLRVFNGELGAGAGQTPGDAGDLAFAYQSRTDRAIPELNTQPTGPYPPLTADVRPGDPWTPILRVYMGDKVRIRVQVGAHEEEHNFTIPGLKWKQEPNSPNSGWRNSEFFGIDEYFNLDVPIVPDTSSGVPSEVDYIYTVGAELEGMWNGVWGILRSYGRERADLHEVNDVGKNGYTITNEDDFNGICPATAPITTIDVTAVRARDVLNQQGQPRQPGDPPGWLVYNDRTTSLTAPVDGIDGRGPLIDPTALMYVRTEDVIFDATGTPIGLRAGTPVEPLILRTNAGDCIDVNLTNALPADLSDTEMPGYNALPPIVHKDENADGAGGITSFNSNDLTPSSYVGLTPQLLAFDPRTNGGFSTGLTTGKLVAPGETGLYRWYAGDVTATSAGVQGNRTRFTLAAEPVEFGAVGLMPADRIKGSENGFVGAMVVEPEGATWIEDPGTRAQATVTKTNGESFRDFVTIMQNDVNLRYGGDGGVACSDPANLATMACAVPNIAAEGPLGPPEDPQDSGNKAINYGADPLWFRLGITPDTPFGAIHRDSTLAAQIPDVFANSLVGGDPQVPVYAASPNGPDYGRFRVLMPGGHARGTTWTLHGHEWQRQPYINGSSEIGDNPISEYYGAQEGVNPTGHWEFVVKLGGHFEVEGDYLWHDQASFGSYQGLWGLLRFDFTDPVVPDQQYELAKYEMIDVDLLGAAFDLDGDAAVVSITDGPGFGTLTDPEGDGVYTYESTSWPGCGDPFACTDSFTYTVTDGQGFVSDPAAVTLTVTNTAPVAHHDTIIIKSPDTGGSVDVLANDVDADADLDAARSPVVTLIGQPVDRDGVQVGTIADAILGIDGRTLTYTPPSGLAGVVRISYTVTDESGAVSNVATVRVAVNVDDITITQALYQPQNGQWTISGTCTDPFLADEITPTTITIVFGPSIEGSAPVIGTATCIAGDPVGTWSFNGQSANPALTTPDPDAFNFVSATSAKEGFDEAFAVMFAGQNNPPVASDDGYTVDEDTVLAGNVLANDADADFDPLTAVLVADVANGTLVLNADGSFTYTPNADYSGSDLFTYQADDGKDLSDVATVTITVNAVNDPPRAGDDAYAEAGAVLQVGTPGVLSNDIDVEGDAFTLNTTPVSGPASGNTLTLNADGSFTYTPDSLFTGTDSFVYEICETATAELLCGQATVTISVGVNDPPIALDDAYGAVQNTELTILAPGVLGNDSDGDGDSLTAILAVGPANGTLTLNGDGSFTYVPAFGFAGVDSFTYTANDGTVDSNVATVTIDVIDVVSVTQAVYRTRQDRWNIAGTVSVPTNTVDLYLDAIDPANLIGAASVDDISGEWSFNGRDTLGATAGDTVIAVSSGGGVSDAFTVSIRAR